MLNSLFPGGIRTRSISFGIFIMLVAIYLFGVVAGRTAEMQQWGWTYVGADPYRYLTNALLHGGLFHIAMNSMVLLQTGHLVEEKMGAFRFIAFSVICAIFVGYFAPLMHFYLKGENTAMLGYSGVIFAYFGILIRFLVARASNKGLAIRTIIEQNMFLVIFLIIPFLAPMGISGEGHLLGLVFGLAAYPLFKR